MSIEFRLREDTTIKQPRTPDRAILYRRIVVETDRAPFHMTAGEMKDLFGRLVDLFYPANIQSIQFETMSLSVVLAVARDEKRHETVNRLLQEYLRPGWESHIDRARRVAQETPGRVLDSGYLVPEKAIRK